MSKVIEIRNQIHTIRGVKVMLDENLASLYQVETKYLVRQFKRNLDRFPDNYAFQLTKDEFLRCQNVTSKKGSGGRRYLPFAFTEHGTLMLASILRSENAIKINQLIIKVFIELRQQIMSHSEYAELKQSIKHIESRMDAISTNNMVDGILVEKKMTTMSADIRRISEALDTFQEGYIVIKRPENGSINEG